MKNKNNDFPSQNKISDFFESILESISDGVFTVDLNWKITSFNRAAEKITGIQREEAYGRLCSEVFKSSMCENNCPLMLTLKNNIPVIDKPCFIIDADGKKIPVSVSTAVLKNQKGHIIGGAETFRDLSEIEALKHELQHEYKAGSFVSYSASMREIIKMVPPVSESSSTILIEGETGTGKEVLARTIHENSPRANEPFIAINCGALPDTLLESELFGYKKGAFTGAEKDKPGKFQIAGKGTILLDEIGEISIPLQVKLLRVLQEKQCEPLGSTKSLNIPARIIAATNKNLKSMVKKNLFRQDLYYRINVITLTLPPLRDRKEDIIPLCLKFINKFNLLQNKNIKSISPEAEKLLEVYDWPGNIRELENVIERAFILSPGIEITVQELPENITGPKKTIRPDNDSKFSSVSDISGVSENAQKNHILFVLKKNNYNKSDTAKELGIHKATLYRKIKKFNLAHHSD
jgi:PAS domain S-box-containing protein